MLQNSQPKIWGVVSKPKANVNIINKFPSYSGAKFCDFTYKFLFQNSLVYIFIKIFAWCIII